MNREAFEGFEFDWFAVDAACHVGHFSTGGFGSVPAQVLNRLDVAQTDELWSLLYAIDRLEQSSTIAKLLATSDVVIADRYTLSNLAHQGVQLEPELRPGFRELLSTLEHSEFGTLRPDMTILIDLDANEVGRRIAAKKPRSYTDRPADIHEVDLDYLDRVRCEYLDLAKLRDIPVITSTSGGDYKSQHDIATEVYSLVMKRLRPAPPAIATVFPQVDRTKLAQAIHAAWSTKRWHELIPQDQADALREADAALVDISRQLSLVNS